MADFVTGRAAFATTGDFHDASARCKPGGRCQSGKLARKAGRSGFLDLAALLADQEYYRFLRAMRVTTDDKRVLRCETVGEAIVEQISKRAINGDGRRTLALGVAHQLDHLIGPDRPIGFHQDIERLLAGWRQSARRRRAPVGFRLKTHALRLKHFPLRRACGKYCGGRLVCKCGQKLKFTPTPPPKFVSLGLGLGLLP